MQNCVYCKVNLPDNVIFCNRCGEKQSDFHFDFSKINEFLPNGCIKCGHPNQNNDAFCTNCGWYIKDDDYIDAGSDIRILVSMGSHAYYPRPDLPRFITDITEYWEYFTLAIRFFDERTLINSCLNFIQTYFSSKTHSTEFLYNLAAVSVDNIYKAGCWISFYDESIKDYFSTVILKLLDEINKHNVRILFIIDNEISEERLHTICSIFNLCNIKVVLPEQDKELLSADIVLEKIMYHLSDRQNVVYIERDDKVNYLKYILDSTSSFEDYVQVFKNEASDFNSKASYFKK